MKTKSPDEFKKALELNPDLLLLDVRTPVEFDEVSIPNSRNLPLNELSPKELLQGTKGVPSAIGLICLSGVRAKKAADTFAQAGFENTIVLERGIEGWIGAGLPVKRGVATVISLERQVRIAAGSLVLIGAVLGWLVNPAFFGLSAFVGGGLVFAGITNFCGMGLLLARMPWNQRARP